MEADIIMLYPEEGRINERQARIWYSDAIENGECIDIGDWETADIYDIVDELNANADITLIIQ
jgi:hypothetical protein